MASVNKVIILGNLGRDPEVRYASNGAAICNVAIATSRTWKDKGTGDKQEETEWHRVVFFDRLAEIAGEYLKKGHPVYVEGRLKTRKWQDKEGRDVYTTEVVAESMQLLGGRDNDSQGDRQPQRGQQQDQRQQRAAQGNGGQASRHDNGGRSGASAGGRQQKPSTGFDDMDDDIPF